MTPSRYKKRPQAGKPRAHFFDAREMQEFLPVVNSLGRNQFSTAPDAKQIAKGIDMKFEVSERIDTTRPREDVMDLALEQFRKISTSAKMKGDQLVAKGLEATFGSINRADKTIVQCKRLDSGWLVTADVAYRPSVMFWIFLIAGAFTYVGWLLPVIFYLIQRNTVKAAAAAALNRIGNELRQAPQMIAGTARPSAMDELEKLAALKERGFITDEEFASKKTQLLRASA